MTFTMIAASIFALQASPQAADDAQEEELLEAEMGAQEETDPDILVTEEKPKKITDKKHPDYVRCKSEAVLGSRARRKRTCMTNREWALVSRRGNEASRDFVADNQPGFQRIPGQN